MNTCKRCSKVYKGGHRNFCSRECRILWIREHNIKGGRKKAEKAYEKAMMCWGSDFDNQE